MRAPPHSHFYTCLLSKPVQNLFELKGLFCPKTDLRRKQLTAYADSDRPFQPRDEIPYNVSKRAPVVVQGWHWLTQSPSFD